MPVFFSYAGKGLWFVFLAGWFLPLPGSELFTLEPACSGDDYFQLSSSSNKDVKSLLLPPAQTSHLRQPRGQGRERQVGYSLGLPEHPT